MDTRLQTLINWLADAGYASRVVNITRLEDLRESIHGLRQGGMLDEDFYKEWLAGFEFVPPDSHLQARSLIILAIPQPQYRISFETQGGVKSLIIPPTYLHGKEFDETARLKLEASLAADGYHAVQAILPKKLLATSSGLGAYGRNNICYVPGMGSFHRLVAFYSDLSCQDDDWQSPKMMAECQNCAACLQACPSGAIAGDRFLLHAERCLTYHNEKPGDIPFANWLQPTWHTCLVGCMRCQVICPQNKPYLNWVDEAARFSIDETDLLLRGTPLEQLPDTMRAKLEANDLADLLDVMPRNLRACGVGI